MAHLRFFAALGGNRPNSLFFAGDLGQRIFQQPFSWLELGVDIRGRSENLNVNYRTSHQIRTQSDRLLAAEISDLDGNLQDRSGTVSVFNGPAPEIRIVKTEEEETKASANGLQRGRKKESRPTSSPCSFALLRNFRAHGRRSKSAAIPFKVLDEKIDMTSGYASLARCTWLKAWSFAQSW